ncbi:MAG: hypothetical protein QM699_16935 [Amaricoccus sp.]|uniref:hypothetical protein n=1 Tax=Amaricoccus sp. TaxID=1872485 RepID=UPI0039E53066
MGRIAAISDFCAPLPVAPPTVGAAASRAARQRSARPASPSAPERFARHGRVLFVEETIPTTHHLPYLEFHAFDGTSVTAIRPRVPDRAAPSEAARLLSGLYAQMLALPGVRAPVLWFYSPTVPPRWSTTAWTSCPPSTSRPPA